MPEGHTIYRYAREHRAALAGRAVTATSPQGRFRAGAARINGRTLLNIATHGKHLFYRWRRAETLHVHLGLYGKFRSFATDPPPPSPNTRLTLSVDGITIYLAGPSVCELILPSQEEAILARLGPDPLQADTDGNSPTAFAANLARRRIPIGAAILDQNVIAGIGNIYRSEALFLIGINPATPANEVGSKQVEQLWSTCVALLERGVADGKIVTTPPGRASEGERLFVYQRERFPCRMCAGPIATGKMANRRIWWCETCQPKTRH